MPLRVSSEVSRTEARLSSSLSLLAAFRSRCRTLLSYHVYLCAAMLPTMSIMDSKAVNKSQLNAFFYKNCHGHNASSLRHESNILYDIYFDQYLLEI